MKRELCALGLLLLLVAGALWNLRSADRLTGRVADSLDRAEQAARQEDYALALQALQEGHALWDSRRTRPGPPLWSCCAMPWRPRTGWNTSPWEPYFDYCFSVSSLESSSMKVLISLKLR